MRDTADNLADLLRRYVLAEQPPGAPRSPPTAPPSVEDEEVIRVGVQSCEALLSALPTNTARLAFTRVIDAALAAVMR